MVLPMSKAIYSVSVRSSSVNVDAVRVRRSAGDLDLPLQPTAAAPAASSRSADGVDLAAQERLTARHIEATCCNPAVELPESCVAFEQSVSAQ